jgi:hypothetical protein
MQTAGVKGKTTLFHLVSPVHKSLRNPSMIPEIYPPLANFLNKNSALLTCPEIKQTGKRPWNPEENAEAGDLTTEISTDSVDTFALALFNESGQRDSRINRR